MIVILNRSPSALLFPKYPEKNMASVNKVFGAVLGKNVLLNSALALYKYVYCIRYFILYSNTAETMYEKSILFAGTSWCNLTSHDNHFLHKYVHVKVGSFEN
jgi:hypothetical protein